MKQHIDSQYKSAFDQLEGNPAGVKRDPSATWDRIASQLDEKKRRRGGIIWWSAAAGIALLIAGTWLIVRYGGGPTPPTSNPNFAEGTPLLPDTLDRDNNSEIDSTEMMTDSLFAMVEELPPPPPPPEEEVYEIIEYEYYASAPPQEHYVEEPVYIIAEKSAGQMSSVSAGMVISKSRKRKGKFSGGKKRGKASNGRSKKQQNSYLSNLDGKRNRWYKNVFKRKKNDPQVIEDLNATEEYKPIEEKDFVKATIEPLSTFSIDVDRAAYANVRRHLTENKMPPPDAVRTEEMVNYFDYEYRVPYKGSQHPFNVQTEVADCPWEPKHRLVHIGIQGQEIAPSEMPTNNLVFLLDVSGSMDSPNKLPLVKQSFEILVKQLRPEDHVSIVVYAGAAGVVLEPTPGNKKELIMQAINNLSPGGSTAGAAGIEGAYRLAERNFDPKGNNRVIIATDGDFNVGISSDNGLERLIEKKRETGIYLTVLGLGTGNYKDARMETLADKGNGNFFYIDQLNEAKKVFGQELSGTLFTIAKDVKIQVEFNPKEVKAYRLIGYENRALRNEDFKNDKIDAGELGAGHTVTALYEIIPASGKPLTEEEELRYQKPQLSETGQSSGEMLEVRLRYKQPKESKSTKIVHQVMDKGLRLDQSSDNFRWSASVAGFSLLLRGSKYKGGATYRKMRLLAESAKGADPYGYRAEFLDLIDRAESLDKRQVARDKN